MIWFVCSRNMWLFCRFPFLPVPVDRTFLRLVEVLTVDQPSLDRAQRQETGQKQQRQAGEQMNPESRLVRYLKPDGEQHARKAAEHHDEECRTICRIGKRIIQFANLALWSEGQKSLKNVPHSAAGAPPPQAGPDRREGRPLQFKGHSSFPSVKFLQQCIIQ